MERLAPKLYPITPSEKLNSLIENRSVVSLPHFVLNVFETHQACNQVELTFEGLTFTSMLRGKKVMHLTGQNPFEYLPGESVIVPGNQTMKIDVPEASLQNPTQCIAVNIDNDKIKSVIEILNDKYHSHVDDLPWELHTDQFHLKNTEELIGTVNRLMDIVFSENFAKEILANLTLDELLIRLMQTQARCLIFENYKKLSSQNRFAFVVDYIHQHLNEDISVKKMSELACMSESHFYKSFRQSFGITPIEYVLQKRIELAKKLLLNPQLSITDICFRTGFNSVNYFSTLFKKYENKTPSAYRAQGLQS